MYGVAVSGTDTIIPKTAPISFSGPKDEPRDSSRRVFWRVCFGVFFGLILVAFTSIPLFLTPQWPTPPMPPMAPPPPMPPRVPPQLPPPLPPAPPKAPSGTGATVDFFFPPSAPPSPSAPCMNAGGTTESGVTFTPEECTDFQRIPWCADKGVSAGCRVHCGLCHLPPGPPSLPPPPHPPQHPPPALPTPNATDAGADFYFPPSPPTPWTVEHACFNLTQTHHSVFALFTTSLSIGHDAAGRSPGWPAPRRSARGKHLDSQPRRSHSNLCALAMHMPMSCSNACPT